MQRWVLGLLSILLIVSCETKEELPHLELDKMKTVLTDIHFAEVYCTLVNDSTHELRNKNVDSLAVYYLDILSHHNITMDDLEQSIVWYQKHPDQLEKVYQDMIPDVATMQDIQDAKGQ